MRKLHDYTVFFRDIMGEAQSLPVKAYNDVDAAARAVSLCEATRAMAASAVGPERVDRARAYVALKIIADEKGGKVIWTNAILDELHRRA